MTGILHRGDRVSLIENLRPRDVRIGIGSGDAVQYLEKNWVDWSTFFEKNCIPIFNGNLQRESKFKYGL
jgi:hypothetical protein